MGRVCCVDEMMLPEIVSDVGMLDEEFEYLETLYYTYNRNLIPELVIPFLF